MCPLQVQWIFNWHVQEDAAAGDSSGSTATVADAAAAPVAVPRAGLGVGVGVDDPGSIEVDWSQAQLSVDEALAYVAAHPEIADVHSLFGRSMVQSKFARKNRSRQQQEEGGGGPRRRSSTAAAA